MSTPTASQAIRPAVALHAQDNGLINVGGSGLNGNSAATGSTASGLPNVGGLMWQPTKLNTKDVGYTAPDGAGGWFYYGPDNVLYRNDYPGEVRASDVGTSAVGTVASYFGAGASGNAPGGASGGSAAAADPFAALAQTFQSLASAGAPAVASAPDSTQPQVVPTQTGGGTNLLIPLLLLALAGAAGWYYFQKSKKK